MACKQETANNVVITPGFKAEKKEANEEKVNDDLASHVEIVVRTWELVKPDLLKHGIAFYLRLLRDHPELKPMFSFGKKTNDEIMENDEKLQHQAKLLMSMIDYAVSCLGNLPKLIPQLKRLGKIHFVKYHVKPEQFQPVGESLLETLREGLGDIFTRDAEAAWTVIYGIIADVMIQGGAENVNDNDELDNNDEE